MPVALADVQAAIGSTEVLSDLCWARSILHENEATFAQRILSNNKRAVTLDNEDHLQTLREPVRAITMMMLTGVKIQLCSAEVKGRIATEIGTWNARWRARSTDTAAEALTTVSSHADNKHLAFKGTKDCQKQQYAVYHQRRRLPDKCCCFDSDCMGRQIRASPQLPQAGWKRSSQATRQISC